MREWLRVSEVAKLMGLSRRGALKRLQVKNRQFNGRLLRRDRIGAPWEVSSTVLFEERILSTPREEDFNREEIEAMRERLEEMDVRLVGTRNSLNFWRRKLDKRLKKTEFAVQKLGEANNAVLEVFKSD